MADLDKIKITEVQQSPSVSTESHILITQLDGTIETLYRAPYAQLFAKIAGKTPVVESLPEATEELRGRTVIYDDGMGDLLYVCVGNVDGSYEWLPLGEDALPSVTPKDDGKVLGVSDGKWTAMDPPGLPAVTIEDDGKIVRAVDGGWELSDSLTVLENKIPWDVEDITSGGDFDQETGTFEVYGNGVYYENGVVHIGAGIAYVDNHIISF